MADPAPAAPPAPLRAIVDFACLDAECQAPVSFNLLDAQAGGGRLQCPLCRREYLLAPEFLDKLQRLRRLILTVQDTADLLGDVNVAITTPMGEVKIPYWLMLTRLNTVVTLELNGRKVEFHFRIEPLNEQSTVR
jgi:hypothetical protein